MIAPRGARRAPWGVAAVVGAIGFLWAVTPIEAHWADQAAAEIAVNGAEARVTLTLPTGLVAFADDARTGRLSNGDARRHNDDLRRFLATHVRLMGRLRGTGEWREGTIDAGPYAGVVSTAAVPAASQGLGGSHSTLGLLYRWPAPIDGLTIRYDLFAPGAPGASCLATVIAGGRIQNVAFTPGHEDAAIGLAAPELWRTAGGFVVMGIEHILTGYDHMLFLLSLLMVGAALPHLLKIVTAFTIAHSITLSLAVLGVVDLPSRWVESAIALSITYVAAENVWRGRASLGSRWLVTFVFGLVHGLGFASALTELHLPRANIAASLVGFNLGVEIGQVAVILLATLALDAIGRCGWAPGFRRWVSVAAAATGLVWFAQRTLGA